MEGLGQCPVAFATRIIGGRWKPRIIWALMNEAPRRFSELRRACPPISDRILTKELKELELWGLVSRREIPATPRRTEYRLTDTGHSLQPVMNAMSAWGLANAGIVPTRLP